MLLLKGQQGWGSPGPFSMEVPALTVCPEATYLVPRQGRYSLLLCESPQGFPFLQAQLCMNFLKESISSNIFTFHSRKQVFSMLYRWSAFNISFILPIKKYAASLFSSKTTWANGHPAGRVHRVTLEDRRKILQLFHIDLRRNGVNRETNIIWS